MVAFQQGKDHLGYLRPAKVNTPASPVATQATTSHVSVVRLIGQQAAAAIDESETGFGLRLNRGIGRHDVTTGIFHVRIPV